MAESWFRKKTADYLRLNFGSMDFERIARILKGE